MQLIRQITEMTHYLNNCKNYQYANLYGNNAFYSLYSSGPDQKYIAGFEKDDICVVISNAQGKSKSAPAVVVKIDRHQFESKELRDYIENNGERTVFMYCMVRFLVLS